VKTVPVGAIALLLADRPDLRAALRPTGRMVGSRVEIDLAAAAARCGPGVAEIFEAYWRRCETVWAGEGTGAFAGTGTVLARRAVADHVQVTAKAGRSDLGAVYETLTGLPLLDAITAELTSERPDDGVLRRLSAPFAGTVEQIGDGALEVVLYTDAAATLPAVLGGVAWPGELQRELRLLARHAAWRDRRVRRLARVSVYTHELWPDPAPCRALLNVALPVVDPALLDELDPVLVDA